jgi:dolichol-phosphate mannosyltransferase
MIVDETSPDIVVVVPTYNERANLPSLIELLTDLRLPALRVLVVDDNSPDGTGDIADKIASGLPETVSVLHRQAKDGLGRAYVAGMGRALAEGADVVIQMDADLSHPAGRIPAMVQKLLAGDADVVIGSRYVAGGEIATQWPWHRKALSVWANFYVNALLGLHVKDATAGFKAWRAPALRAIDLPTIHSNGYAFQVEMNHRAVRRGLKIAEIPITFEERTIGKSKLSLGVQIESAVAPWRLRFGTGRRRSQNRS